MTTKGYKKLHCFYEYTRRLKKGSVVIFNEKITSTYWIKKQLNKSKKTHTLDTQGKLAITKFQCFGSGSGWIWVSSPIRIRVLKVRIRIPPCINFCDLNDGFDKVLEKPDQKRWCRVLVMKCNFFLYFYPSIRTFFSRIRIQIFPDRIRSLADPDPDSEKKVWSGSGKKNSDPKHCKIH